MKYLVSKNFLTHVINQQANAGSPVSHAVYQKRTVVIYIHTAVDLRELPEGPELGQRTIALDSNIAAHRAERIHLDRHQPVVSRD